ncbi:MAG TPA: TlpA disulfide reductase family protein [Thermoanaerobaculia bacterium]|nr:TlpA disulfide reductase family protein [Thermoanaerobaculia bacterium]
MRKCARFAVSFLSLLVALPLFSADLRKVKEPAQIAAAFPRAAKLRVVYVWALWCAPCVAEMPDLRAIDDAFGPEVALTGISLDDMLPDASPKPVAAFLDKQKIKFPNIYYTGNSDALADWLRFSGEIPVTIVFDAKGKELWRHQGRLDRNQTIAQLRDLLRRTP